MAVRGFADYGNAMTDDGAYHYQYVYKTALPTPVTAGVFIDANQTSGIPVYNAFAGSALTLTPLTGSRNQGVYVGPEPAAGLSKRLLRWQVGTSNTSANTTPSNLYLCDYLGFYPLIDADSTDQQDMDNTLSPTRYVDGKGVRIVLVATAPMTVTASCTLVYTNQDGVTGRSVTFNVFPAANIGVCATAAGTTGAVGANSPFVNLIDGDTGVRAIESITFAAGAGGFLCACLVKPLATISNYEALTRTEKAFGFEWQKLPVIEPGAYLNFLIQRGSTAASTLQSEFVFINK